MNGYRKEKLILDFPQPIKMSNKLITQPHCALTLRDIMTQFSQGEVTVRAHMPTNDFVDSQSDEQFDKSGTFEAPENFEDDFEAHEFVLNQKQIVETTEETPNQEQQQEQKQEQKPEQSQEKVEEK